MGGLTQGLEINTFEIARELARRLEARCSYLVAPIYTGSPQSRDTILQQEVFALSGKDVVNDLALLSIGELSTRSLLVRHGLPKDVTMEELKALGAVGDIMGQFFSRDGVLIPHVINERVIALSFDDLRKVETTIFAAGGNHKTEAIAGVLSAGLCSVLVCDEDTAEAAAAMARRPAGRRTGGVR
jgi:DNA-binding transcriptional regulator LsrR (DeoR family)